ncbi:MAG: hypothetical protein R2726_09220 [Acidimicrobiales bacterium]
MRAGRAGRLAVLLAVSTIVAACSGDVVGTGGAAPAATGTTAPTVAGAELAGRWAHYDIVAYQGSPMKTMIISYGFTDFAVEGDRLIESEEFCHADQVTDQPIKTSISDAGTRAIKPVSTPVEVSGEAGARRVLRPGTPTPVGIRLADPANEALPTDPRDPRIVDDDGDGKPGITVVVHFGEAGDGELYLARREIFAYDMVQDGPDSLRGTVKDSSEQLVVGASLSILENTDANWAQVPDRSLSPILLQRVGRDWDCDRLMAERGRLFPPDPGIGW